MKKFLPLFLAIGVASASVSAQELVKIAPEIGGSLNSMNLKYDGNQHQTSPQLGFRLGTAVDITYNDHFSLQPGLFFSFKNGTKSSFQSNYSTGGGVPASIQDDRTYSVTYMQIPVYALYKTGDEYSNRFFVGAGPYLSFALGGRFQRDFTNRLHGQNITKRLDNPIVLGAKETDDLRRVDLGLQFTTGFETSTGIYFRFHYGYGVLNTSPVVNADNSIHQKSGAISIGYFFKVHDKNNY